MVANRCRTAGAWRLRGGCCVLLVAVWLAACGDASLSPTDGGGDGGAVTDGGGDTVADGGDTAADGGDTTADGGDTTADAGLWQPCAGLPPAIEERGRLVQGDELAGNALAACRRHRYWVVAAAGEVLQIALRSHEPLGRVEVALGWPDVGAEAQMLRTLSAAPGEGIRRLRFAAPRSGELALWVRAADIEAAGDYDLALRCVELCDRRTTRFPIALVHGWTGWDEVESYTYFYRVPENLRQRGYGVFVASLDPYNSTAVRSGQLAEQLGAYMNSAHARRVNLIAHSQGGLDARRVISSLGFGERVASLTTISTPHRGTPIADVGLGLLPGFAEDALAWFLEWLGATAVGSESDAIASFESLTTGFVQDEFNPANPDAPGVRYISYAGKTCPFGLTCGDVCDIEIRWAYYVLLAAAGANDGIVPVDSAKWGDYRGTIPADHFDEVGQLLGVTGPNFDHLAFYRELARDLAESGL